MSTGIAGPYLEFFCWGGAEGATRVVKASTEGTKLRGGLENFEKLDALRGVFPPSQKQKDILVPIKCTFWVNFVGKILRNDKKAI
jgi:hypothetical protein